MKQCQKCGAISAEDALFCGNCGTRFPDDEEVREEAADSGSLSHDNNNQSAWKMDIDWDSYIQSDLPVVKDYLTWYKDTPWEELDEMCSMKDPAALFEKGIRFYEEEDAVQAASCFEQVLKLQKNTEALYYMGKICLDSLNSSDCVKCFRLGSSLDHAECSFMMGEIYRRGYYVEKNPDQAIQYYELSGKQGRAISLGSAGEVCLDSKDYEKAFAYFTAAYEQNPNPITAYYIGRMYYLGTGVEENDEKALLYLKEASDGGKKAANYYLGNIYGFGYGTKKDVDLAMKLLNDVEENYRASSYNTKGRIMLTEGNNDEARFWLQKAAELGDEDAQSLLDSGAGKTVEELANEGSDPYAMIRYSSQLLGNGGHSPDLKKAREVITRANALYPDNIDVKKHYIRMLDIVGHVDLKIGANEQAYELFTQCIEEMNALRAKNIDVTDLKKIEMGIFMDCGEAAYNLKKTDEAIRLFSQTDHNEYPYAVVQLAILHMQDPLAYGRDLVYDANFLNQSLNSDKWREPFERAAAYYILAAICSEGVSGYIHPDVNYAYTCIQKCAEINPELAESELSKYSKNMFGQVVYRP